MSERAALTRIPENKGKKAAAAKPKENFYESMDSPMEQIFHLQRTIGNQAVQRLINSGTIQAKLKIGRPNDKYEQEADQVADKVMRMSEPHGSQRSLVNGHWSLGKKVTPLIQKQEQPGEEEERNQEEEEQIQTKPIVDQITPLVQRQVGPGEEEEPAQTKRIQRQETKEEEEPGQTKLLQPQETKEEEESVQTKLLQRKEAEEEEEPVQTKLLQCQETEEEEKPVQTKLLQRQEKGEEEEPIQTKLVQRQVSPEEEEKVQTKFQRQPEEEEEEAQTKLQRQTEEEEEPVQAKQGPNRTPAVTSNIETSVNSLKGGGQPLSESIRSYFEPRFGTDFSQVRLHTDSKAAETAKSINAKAFTKGKDVVFGAGQYSPRTSKGKQLLAHELTHVMQQNGTDIARSPDDTLQSATGSHKNIEKLDEMLDRWDVPEDDVINILGKLTSAERKIVIQGNYKGIIANALDTGEMVRAVKKLKLPLYQQLEWVKTATSPTSIDYNEIKSLVFAAPQKQRNALKTKPWQQFFIDVCTNETIGEAVDDLNWELSLKILWMYDEGTDYETVKGKIRATTSATKKTDLYKDYKLKKIFVSLCDDKQMVEAVDLLGGTLYQKLSWMKAVGCPWELIKPKISDTSVSPSEKTALYNFSTMEQYFTSECDEKEIAEAVKILGGTIVQKVSWMFKVGTSVDLLYSVLKSVSPPSKLWNRTLFEDIKSRATSGQYKMFNDAKNLILGDQIIAAMEVANRDDEKIDYPEEEYHGSQIGGVRAGGRMGYMDPAYWVQLNVRHPSGAEYIDPITGNKKLKYSSFALAPHKKPSDAMRAAFSGPTRLECLSLTNMVLLKGLLEVMGDVKFNHHFKWHSATDPGLVVGTKKTYVREKHKELLKDPDVSSVDDLIKGDWIYYQNDKRYPKKHPAGYWRGENCIYEGNGLFSGFGLPNMTEDDLEADMEEAFTDNPSPEDIAANPELDPASPSYNPDIAEAEDPDVVGFRWDTVRRFNMEKINALM